MKNEFIHMNRCDCFCILKDGEKEFGIFSYMALRYLVFQPNVYYRLEIGMEPLHHTIDYYLVHNGVHWMLFVPSVFLNHFRIVNKGCS